MTLYGVCLDALREDGAPPPDTILWADLVRLVVSDSSVVYAYVQALQEHGIKVAAVWASESFPDGVPDAQVVERICRRIRPEFHVIGNEADSGALSEESVASQNMTPSEYASYFGTIARAIRRVDAHAHLLTFGSVSGRPDVYETYLAEVERHGYAIQGQVVHPWAKSAPDAAELLRLYRERQPAYPVHVMEWNRPPREIGEYAAMLDAERVASACFFSHHTFDVPGLVDAEGHHTDRYHAYLEALAAVRATPADFGPEEPMSEYTVGQGIETAMNERGDEPACNETYRGDGQVSEAFGVSGNWYVYLPATNTVQVFKPAPKA